MVWTTETERIHNLLYQISYCSALALLGNGQNSIHLQYVDPADRVGAQGMYTALNGLSCFIDSLAGGCILAVIPENDNIVFGDMVFGIPMCGHSYTTIERENGSGFPEPFFAAKKNLSQCGGSIENPK